MPTPVDVLFFDDFNTLSLENTRDASTHGNNWQPAYWYATDGIELTGNQSWEVNPFNPATPIPIYTVANSILTIGVQQTPQQYKAACGNAPYVSGTLTTVNSFKHLYGYFEARIKVPKIQGLGAAFWMMTDAHWPPEVDIAEIVSPEGTNNQGWLAHTDIIDVNTQQPTHDYYTYQPGPFQNNYDPSQWHTYGMLWTAQTITIYYDRQQVISYPTPPGYDIPMMMILELDCGSPGGWSGPIIDNSQLPSGMQVDYVMASSTRPF